MQLEQIARHIFLVRPAHFGANPETADSNAFQATMDSAEKAAVSQEARKEFDGVLAVLEENQVSFQVFDDTQEPIKPDAIFPNNWVSTHPDGKVLLYPMMAPARRAERRPEIVTALAEAGGFEITEIVNLSYFEEKDIYCEGTGSLTIDHVNGILFACLSDRTHREAVLQVAEELDYAMFMFEANGPDGKPLYHTNVMMNLGADFAVVCMDAIVKEDDKATMRATLKKTKRMLEEITMDQMVGFAGNVYPVMNRQGKKLILMSQSAHDCLTLEQRVRWSAYGKLVPMPIPTIEKYGGGSIRCMMAGIHLPKL